MDKAAGDALSTRTHAGRTGAASYVVALSLLIVAGFSALAVDYAFLHHKRGTLREAARQGALAGARLLVDLGQDVGAVRDATVRATQAGLVPENTPELAVRSSDVVFLRDGRIDERNPDQVEVTAGCTAMRGNPVSLFLGGLWGQRHADVSESAGAGLYCVAASSGLGPLAVAAAFDWDDACDASPEFRNNGRLDAASSCEAESARVTGFSALGDRLVLSGGEDGAVGPGTAYLARAGGAGGANGGTVAGGLRLAVGDRMDLAGAEESARGLRDQAAMRLRQDPGAYFDPAGMAVRGSRFASPGESPRLLRLAFFDPRDIPGPHGRKARVVHLGAVFIEELLDDGKVAVRLARGLADDPKRLDGACAVDGVGLYGVGSLPVPPAAGGRPPGG